MSGVKKVCCLRQQAFTRLFLGALWIDRHDAGDGGFTLNGYNEDYAGWEGDGRDM